MCVCVCVAAVAWINVQLTVMSHSSSQVFSISTAAPRSPTDGTNNIFHYCNSVSHERQQKTLHLSCLASLARGNVNATFSSASEDLTLKVSALRTVEEPDLSLGKRKRPYHTYHGCHNECQYILLSCIVE